MPGWWFRSGFRALLMLTGFLLPFNPSWLGWMANAACVLWFMAVITQGLTLQFDSWPLRWSLGLLIYLILAYTLVYRDTSGLLKMLETRAGLWLGLLFVCGSGLTVTERRSLWIALRTGLDISLILCFLFAFGAFLLTFKTEKLIHSDFSRFMHAGYLSALIFMILFNEILAGTGTYFRLLLYGLSLILLSSKAVWVATVATAVVLAFHFGRDWLKAGRLNYKKALWLLLLLPAPVLVLPRIEEAWKEIQGRWPEKAWRSSVLVRRAVWRCGLEEIPSVPLWGVGETRLRRLLDTCYKEKALSVALKNRYNLHNQFIEEYLLHGAAGWALFVLIAFALAQRMAVHAPLMAILMMFIFLFWGMSESFLQRSQGCLWLGFLWPLSTALYEKDTDSG